MRDPQFVVRKRTPGRRSRAGSHLAEGPRYTCPPLLIPGLPPATGYGSRITHPYRLPRTYLRTDLAPRAQPGVDLGLAALAAFVQLVALEYRRAADAETQRAAVAATGQHRERLPAPAAFRQQGARLAG